MKRLLFSSIFALSMLLCGQHAAAEEVVYQLQEFNGDTQAFILKSYGRVPEGAVAEFWNDYGATAGNRFNQIPRNKQASLYLYGFGGCRIDSITLSMCSNNSKGTAALRVTAGDTVLYTMAAREFADAEWYGEWLSKDHAIYADITKVMQRPYIVRDTDDVEICIKGGTAEGSVYIKRFVVHYTPMEPIITQSPMGYYYEKLEAKSTLADLDTVIFFRSGYTAADIDGMATAHYLDAIGINTYTDVCEPDVLHFVLHRTEDAHWQLISQWGDTLAATGEKALAWSTGVNTWDITLGYNGAEITSTHASYGTMRFNAPTGSYPRFNCYASSGSLPLPYLYKRIRQNQPIAATGITLSSTYREVELGTDTLILRASLLPKSTTDERLRWASTDTAVATVRDGIVHPHAIGVCDIVVTSWDEEQTATCRLLVKEQGPDPQPDTAIDDINSDRSVHYIDLLGRPIRTPAPYQPVKCIRR